MGIDKIGNKLNSKRFGIALQALMILAYKEKDGICSSDEISNSLQSQPTLLRRILAQLVKANIVQAREGRYGGYQLCKSAEKISLAEIYYALNVSLPFSIGLLESVKECSTPGLVEVFEEVTTKISEQVLGLLEQYTLNDVIQKAIQYSK